LRWLILPVLLALAWFTPRVGDHWFGRIERLALRFSTRKRAILTTSLVARVARLALLWAIPVPIPAVHDEFSYLLQADTFLHGRLTNPPHPMWVFLDTFHVLQHPTYQSMYPPAQGAALAVGQLLGHPWIGVLLSMAAMCAALTWMLQGWFPASWALLGGVLVLLRICLFTYWLESYWGGAVAAAGGALVLGAFPRIIHSRRTRHVVVMGIGMGLLANSRPLEGFIFCIPVIAALLIWLVSNHKDLLTITGPRVLSTLLGVLAVTLVFMGYYNWRVTQDIFVFPRALYQRERLNFPVFSWQPPNTPLHYSNPQFEDFYNVATPKLYSQPWPRLSLEKCRRWWLFFVGGSLSIPLVTFPWILKDRRCRLPLVQFLWCALGLLVVNYFFPHYAAPLVAAIFILIVQGMRHLRHWEPRGRAVGIFLTRLVVILALTRTVLGAKEYWHHVGQWSSYRAEIADKLEATRSNHLVLVRYAPSHFVEHEWVYNAADIDHSRIVWVREIPGRDLRPLLEYFKDRMVWVVEADALPPKLEEYQGSAEQSDFPLH
jgi:hypothetical protein